MAQIQGANYAFYAAIAPILSGIADLEEGPAVDPELLDRVADVTSRLIQQPPPYRSEASEASPRELAQVIAGIDAAQTLRAALSGLSADDAEALDQFGRLLDELRADLGAQLRQDQADRIRGLYVIIDPQVTGGRDPLTIAEAALQGGAKMLQLRDKLRDKGQSLPLAQELQRLCEAHDALLIINDHLDLAAAVRSGGAHVGQTDLPVAEARKVLAPNQVLGRSNREFEQMVQSAEMGADHLAFGPIYMTDTKSIVRNPQGPERLRQARAVSDLPLVAIGGINARNVGPVIDAGADAVCVTAAVGAASDPEAAVNQLVEAIRQAGGKV